MKTSNEVIVISGSVGSGKSTVISKLMELMGDVAILRFDDYQAFVEWPKDMKQWISNGANPDQIKVPKLKEDLLSLLKGKAVINPADGNLISPAKIILLEEPSGRLREELAAWIKQVVFIDVPYDICVARIIQRVLDMETWRAERTFAGLVKEELVAQLDNVAMWLEQYRNSRSMYWEVSEAVRQQADLIVDGMQPVDEVARIIFEFIRRQ
jgi:uridine kinase